LHLNYVSWADHTGYAVAAQSYLRAFHRAGVPVAWTPMLPDDTGYRIVDSFASDHPVLSQLAQADKDADTVVVHTVPEYFPQHIEAARRAGRRIFGYTVWELEDLPDHWPAILNRLDGVIVPCTWNVEVFRRSGVSVPIHVVPHLSQFGARPTVAGGEPAPLPPTFKGEAFAPGRFMFYTIGYWSNRKAPDLVARAFLKAFGPADPVSLVIKTSRNDITRWHRHWRNGFRRRHPSPVDSLRRLSGAPKTHPPIAVIADENLPDADMLALHSRGDCFVSLARAEGWGLGAFDAALMGKPVVMTGYGGQLDFLDPAGLVDYRMVPVHEPTWGGNYRPADRWAEPDLDHAVSLMRQVYENRDASFSRARTVAEGLASRFSDQAILAAWEKALA